MTTRAPWPDPSANPLDDVRWEIAEMRERVDCLGGVLSDAMCRLSLPMAEFLIEQLDLAERRAETLRDLADQAAWDAGTARRLAAEGEGP